MQLICYPDIMSFNAEQYLFTPRFQHIRLGLSRMHLLMEKLDHPEKKLHAIHVAGTNGKGSTCAYLSAICKAAHIRTALFTSPHLEHISERISIDGVPISDKDLTATTLHVKEAASKVEYETGEHPTEFELLAAVAFSYFAQENPELCIIEVGLGGRLDATNVLTPDMCVITPIDLDHTSLLGSTIEEIAHEKAGIIKPGVPCIIAPQHPDALGVLLNTCKQVHAPYTVVNKQDITIGCIHSAFTRKWQYKGKPYTTKLLGTYQPENAAVALEAAVALQKQGAAIADESIQLGLAQALWPGRFEVLSTNPTVLVDGAHNPAGVRSLFDSLGQLVGDEPKHITCIVGVLEDKDAHAMLSFPKQYQYHVYTYMPQSTRARTAESTAQIIQELNPTTQIVACASASHAAALACNEKTPESCIVAFGSLYSLAEIKKVLLSNLTR